MSGTGQNEIGRGSFLRRAVYKMPCFRSSTEVFNTAEDQNAIPMTHGTAPAPTTASLPPSVSEAGRVSRTPDPHRAPKPTGAEVERAAFGLKVMYDGVDAEVDIITLHGLDGHRERTFTADNGVCWLDSLLPDKMPKIRVISFGYDARTHSSSPLSQQHLHSHAEQLVENLTRRRDMTNTMKRPIIFIAHSLGGIVVKSALILSASYNSSHREAQKSISLSTHGILFMGTPHAGGGGVTWGKLALNLASIVKNTKADYLDVLERNSQWLEQQQVQYNSISSRYDTKFFYEIYETELSGGLKLLIVPRHSACVAGAVDSSVIGISSNHSNMVKFKEGGEESFKAVEDTLQIMLREATHNVNSNWLQWERIKAIGEAQEISYCIPMSLPFPRNHNFTGRKEELLDIYKAFTEEGASGQRILVLCGLGGIGKSQLAMEYAYGHQHTYTSVWWVNANTTASLSQDFLTIAQQLVSYHAHVNSTGRIPDYCRIAMMLRLPADAVDQAGQLVPPIDMKPIIEAVKSWLVNKENHKWLMIVDNYDDLETVKITDFLPNSSGSIIITSRAQGSRRLGSSFELDVILLEDGIEILRKSAGTKMEQFANERTAAISIVDKLGALPLALDQAGSYISSAQIPYNLYLPRFNREFARIAAKRPPNSVWKYREDTIFTTWEISFAALGPGAQALILLCGFLDNEDIWEGLLVPENLKSMYGIDSVDDAIEEIFSLSLAKRTNLGTGFWIHSLVHRWSRERQNRTEMKRNASTAVSLTAAASSKKLHDRHLQRRFMPHIKLCSNHILHEMFFDPLETDLREIREVDILRGILDYFSELRDAEGLNRWVLVAEEKILGKDHPDTLATVHDMAFIFVKQEKYDDALEWNERALAGREKALGMDHPDTLATVHNMAMVFLSQGKYNDALEWYGRALAGTEKAFGKDHIDTLTTGHNIAIVFYKQGKYDDALEWDGRTLTKREKTLGKDHPDTLATVHSMATVFQNQGKYDEALEWYGRALAGIEKALGKDHPDILATVHNMAMVFQNQGKYDDALEWYGRALAGAEKALGKDNSNTLVTIHNMATVFQNQGKYDDALEWYRRALAGKEKALGKDHPDTLATVHSMATLFQDQGKYDEALEWYGRAFTETEKALGKDHSNTLATIHNMATVFQNQGKYDDALEWYGRALAGCEKALGKDHPDTLATIHGMASVFLMQGKYDDAREWYGRALAGREKAFSKDHPNTKSSRDNRKVLIRQETEREEADRSISYSSTH